MDNDGAVLGLRVLVHHLKKSAWHEEYEEYEAHAAADLAHPPPELEQRVAEGVRVAGPLGVVELDHLPLLPVLPQPDRSAGAGGGLDTTCLKHVKIKKIKSVIDSPVPLTGMLIT